MMKSIFATIVSIACLSGITVSVFADDMEMVRQDCQDEVAGYGIVDVDEQQQAVDDCIATRVGSSDESETDMSMPPQDNE